MLSYLFLILTVQGPSFVSTGVPLCSSQADCFEGYSCDGNICKKCLKCDLLYRKGNSCTDDFTDCGDCLDGYEEISMTVNSFFLKPCKPMKKKVKLKECTVYKSCPLNSYCIEETCVKCFDCTLVNRQPPSDNCAKGLTECGPCIKGFSEISVTIDKNFKPCDVVKESMTENFLTYDASFATIVTASLFLVLLFVAVIFVILKNSKKFILSKSISRCPINPSAPPLYAFDAPKIKKQGIEEESSFFKIVKEQTQQAKVFKQPDAPYYFLGEETNPVESLGDQTSGIIENALPAARPEVEEINCTDEIDSSRLLELSVTDSSSSNPQQSNNAITGSNESSSTNAIVLNMPDTGQDGETSGTERKDATEHPNEKK